MVRALSTFMLALALLAPIAAHAGSAYDWRTGNTYNWNSYPGGDTHVRGYNFGTGSQWNTTVRPNGDMRGTDSNGHMWNYNSGSGTYHNYGTGRTCYGQGAARTCY